MKNIMFEHGRPELQVHTFNWDNLISLFFGSPMSEKERQQLPTKQKVHGAMT